jgi:hypothetical protein
VRRHKNIIYTPRFLIIFTLLALPIIAVSASRTTNKKQDDLQKRLQQVIETTEVEDLTITNQTSAFRVINIEKIPDGIIRLSLQNGYRKNITAYRVSIGSNLASVDTLLSMQDETIAPGRSKDELLALEVDPDLKSKGIVIHAVVFDDGTADGNIDAIKEIQDYRLGEQAQIEHVNNFLRANSMLSTKSHLDIAKDLQSNMLSPPPQGGEPQLPKYVRFGIQGTKQGISRLIEKIVNAKDENTEKRFAALSEYIAEKASVLRKYVEAIKVEKTNQ